MEQHKDVNQQLLGRTASLKSDYLTGYFLNQCLNISLPKLWRTRGPED